MSDAFSEFGGIETESVLYSGVGKNGGVEQRSTNTSARTPQTNTVTIHGQTTSVAVLLSDLISGVQTLYLGCNDSEVRQKGEVIKGLLKKARNEAEDLNDVIIKNGIELENHATDDDGITSSYTPTPDRTEYRRKQSVQGQMVGDPFEREQKNPTRLCGMHQNVYRGGNLTWYSGANLNSTKCMARVAKTGLQCRNRPKGIYSP